MEYSSPSRVAAGNTAEADHDSAWLEGEVTSVGSELLVRIREVLDALPRAIKGPQSLARSLGVDKVLASRVLKATRSEDPISVAYRMPGPDPLRRVVKAAAKRGVSNETAADALRAIDRFEALIRDHIGDRSLLDAMLSAWIPEARREFELRRKQSAFKAMSQLKGVQTEAIVATVVLSPSPDGEHIDVVWINGLTGLHRVRPGAPVKLATRRMSVEPSARRPVTLDGQEIESPRTLLLDGFCSQPPPRMDVRRVGEVVHYSLADHGFGARSAVDLFFAEVNIAELKRFVPAGVQRKGYFFAEIMTPAVLLQFDVLVHEDLYPAQSPSLLIYDTAFEGVADVNNPARDIDRMEMLESIEPLGSGASRFRSPDIGRYTDLVRHVMETMRLDPARFRGHRCHIDYPIYGSQVVMAFDAVQRGGQ
ncbi:MAG: hypothetical protein KF745_00435 [Phycisphaeraceae bacterium]|nr:hypothetical protein [Phycisphaeraceae bacterium]